MNINDLNVKNRHHIRESYVKNNFPELYENVNNYSYDKNLLFQQKLYNYLYEIKSPVKCRFCKNENVKFIKFYSGYLTYCSVKCSKNDDVIRKKTINTNLIKYGVDNVSKNKDIQQKIVNTNLKKYGVNNVSKNKDIVNKIKNIKFEKELNDWKIKLNNSNIKIEYLDNDDILISGYCDEHETFIIKRQTLYSRYYRQTLENVCTVCNPINENVSNVENDLRNFIEKELLFNTEKIQIDGKEIDIFIPKHKLGIEFDGLYYHSNLFKDKNYHLHKTNVAEDAGISLLHIFEDEWLNKKNIVKSIIKSKLGLFDEKIYARLCSIKELKSDETIDFLNKNHIQGGIGSKIRLGLYYQNELVGVMTFGKKRLAMGNKGNNADEYELLRYCNKLNFTIIGGYSKLLKYFIKIYNPNSILTFADRRYSQGNIYDKNGFKFMYNTEPNYWYFNPNKTKLIRYHRFKFRKDVLIKEGFDKDKTEREIMSERGFLKIYDCGNKKYELNLKE